MTSIISGDEFNSMFTDQSGHQFLEFLSLEDVCHTEIISNYLEKMYIESEHPHTGNFPNENLKRLYIGGLLSNKFFVKFTVKEPVSNVGSIKNYFGSSINIITGIRSEANLRIKVLGKEYPINSDGHFHHFLPIFMMPFMQPIEILSDNSSESDVIYIDCILIMNTRRNLGFTTINDLYLFDTEHRFKVCGGTLSN